MRIDELSHPLYRDYALIAVLEEAHTDGLPRVILKFTFTELKTLTSYWQR